MTKVSLTIKNAYPELYGYQHPWYIPGNELCGKMNPLNIGKKKGEYPEFQIPFTDFEDVDEMIRYYPCSSELMRYDFTEKDREKKRKDMMTRCMVSSERKGLVRCMHPCSTCPYKKNPNDLNEEHHRYGEEVSMDYLYEEFELEFSSPTTDMAEKLYRESILEQAKELIKQRSELDQQIADLLDLSDSEIARRLNKPRTTIRDSRKRMIADLKRILKI